MRPFALVLAAVLAVPVATAAQAPAAPAPAPAAPAPDLPSPPADYTYGSAGRRDPFTSLMTTTSGPITTKPTSDPRKPGDLLVDEISVRGIVLSNGSYVAMVSGPGARQNYTVKAGDRFFDGTVQSITADAVVILQQVSDPLSLEKQRQVRKPLRTQEEGK